MAASWPRPVEIFEHYLRSREALSLLKSHLLNFPATIGSHSRFYNMLPGEINATFRDMTSELNIQINLLLIASGEASLRVDFEDRVQRRRKGPVSRRFRELEQARKARAKRGVRLEDILKVWGDESPGPSKGRASRMGQLLLYRHWVAHGRYWVDQRSGLSEPDPREVWDIMREFFDNLPGFDPPPTQ